jgi:hypothetical protein
MSLIKKDKGILDLFRGKQVKKELEPKEKSKEKQGTVIGNILFIILVLAISFGGSYFLQDYLPSNQTTAFKHITLSIGAIIFWLFKMKGLFGSIGLISYKVTGEEEEDYEDEEEDE